MLMSKLSNTISHENYSYLPPYLFLFIWGVLFILIIALPKPDSSGRRRANLSACGHWCCWTACCSKFRAPRECETLIWTRRQRGRICYFIAGLGVDLKRAKPSRLQPLTAWEMLAGHCHRGRKAPCSDSCFSPSLAGSPVQTVVPQG